MSGIRTEAAEFQAFCERNNLAPATVRAFLVHLFQAQWHDVEDNVCRITFFDGSTLVVDTTT